MFSEQERAELEAYGIVEEHLEGLQLLLDTFTKIAKDLQEFFASIKEVFEKLFEGFFESEKQYKEQKERWAFKSLRKFIQYKPPDLAYRFLNHRSYFRREY